MIRKESYTKLGYRYPKIVDIVPEMKRGLIEKQLTDAPSQVLRKIQNQSGKKYQCLHQVSLLV